MIRVMLVDDEPFVRMAIRTIFDWERHGFTILSEANNGAAAIEKMRENPPDLLVTDIRMPIVDGILLLRHVKEHYPTVRSVVLSNYDDFDLVRSAFVEGAVDYVLKNDLNAEQFQALAERIQARYFSRPDAPDQDTPAEAPASLTDRISALRQLIGGAPPQSPLTDFLEQTPYLLCKIKMDLPNRPQGGQSFSPAHTELISSTVYKIISETLEYKSLYYAETPMDYVLLIHRTAEATHAAFLEGLKPFFQSLLHNLHLYLNATAVLGISAEGLSPAQLPEAYGQAQALALGLFYVQTSAIFYWRPNETPYREVSSVINDHLKHLPEWLQHRDFGALRDFFSSLCTLVRAEKYPPQNVLRMVSNLTYLIDKESQLQQVILAPAETSGIEQLQEKIQACEKMDDLEPLLQAFLDGLEESSLHWLGGRRESYSPIITKALKYMHSHFQDPSLNLGGLAHIISVNSSYLSRLFSQELSIDFNTYLNRLRINHSKKQLLSTRESISTIAEQSGYQNTKYYINLFRKLEGTTPNAYRRRIQDDGVSHMEDP